MNKFAFIGHPIDLQHLYNILGFWGNLVKILPRNFVKDMLIKLPPYKYNYVENIRSIVGALTSGYVIMCLILPEQVAFMGEDFAIKKTIQAIKYGEKLGANLAALGGFTSVIGNEGEIVSKSVNIAVTSGNTYTAVLALEGIYKSSQLMGLNLGDTTTAIVGATGDIGSICTKILSKKVKVLNIAARNEKRLNEFAAAIRQYGKSEIRIFRYTKDAVRDADIVLTVTSAVTTLIEPQYLKSGAIVCDVAIPANIAKEVIKVRDDVFVFEGGLAKLSFPEEIRNNAWKRALPHNSIYGCLAEGLLLCLDNRIESYSIGRGNITEEKINEMTNIACKHGFSLSDFFCGYKFYSDEDIENIRKNARKNKEKSYVAQG